MGITQVISQPKDLQQFVIFQNGQGLFDFHIMIFLFGLSKLQSVSPSGDGETCQYQHVWILVFH